MKFLKSVAMIVLIIAAIWTVNRYFLNPGPTEPAQVEETDESSKGPWYWFGKQFRDEPEPTEQPQGNQNQDSGAVFYDNNGDGYPDMPANSGILNGCGELLEYLHGWGRNYVPSYQNPCRTYYNERYSQVDK